MAQERDVLAREMMLNLAEQQWVDGNSIDSDERAKRRLASRQAGNAGGVQGETANGQVRQLAVESKSKSKTPNPFPRVRDGRGWDFGTTPVTVPVPASERQRESRRLAHPFFPSSGAKNDDADAYQAESNRPTAGPGRDSSADSGFNPGWARGYEPNDRFKDDSSLDHYTGEERHVRLQQFDYNYANDFMFVGPFAEGDTTCSNSKASEVKHYIQKPIEVKRGWGGLQCQEENCRFVKAYCEVPEAGSAQDDSGVRSTEYPYYEVKAGAASREQYDGYCRTGPYTEPQRVIPSDCTEEQRQELKERVMVVCDKQIDVLKQAKRDGTDSCKFRPKAIEKIMPKKSDSCPYPEYSTCAYGAGSEAKCNELKAAGYDCNWNDGSTCSPNLCDACNSPCQEDQVLQKTFIEENCGGTPVRPDGSGSRRSYVCDADPSKVSATSQSQSQSADAYHGKQHRYYHHEVLMQCMSLAPNTSFAIYRHRETHSYVRNVFDNATIQAQVDAIARGMYDDGVANNPSDPAFVNHTAGSEELQSMAPFSRWIDPTGNLAMSDFSFGASSAFTGAMLAFNSEDVQRLDVLPTTAVKADGYRHEHTDQGVYDSPDKLSGYRLHGSNNYNVSRNYTDFLLLFDNEDCDMRKHATAARSEMVVDNTIEQGDNALARYGSGVIFKGGDDAIMSDYMADAVCPLESALHQLAGYHNMHYGHSGETSASGQTWHDGWRGGLPSTCLESCKTNRCDKVNEHVFDVWGRDDASGDFGVCNACSGCR